MDLRPVPGYEGYFAGDDGRIYSIKLGTLRALTQSRCDKDGYPVVQLTVNSKNRVRAVHRLVARAFHGRPPGAQVRHLDGDKKNSRPSNLLWGSAKENARDRDRHGHTQVAERHVNAKLSNRQVRRIKAMLVDGTSQASVAKAFNVCRATISHISTGRLWRSVK